jgi:hypothetical protein
MLSKEAQSRLALSYRSYLKGHGVDKERFVFTSGGSPQPACAPGLVDPGVFLTAPIALGFAGWRRWFPASVKQVMSGPAAFKLTLGIASASDIIILDAQVSIELERISLLLWNDAVRRFRTFLDLLISILVFHIYPKAHF